MPRDERKTKSELLYELRLQRLENLRLQEQLSHDSGSADRRQLVYLKNTALIDEAIRKTTDLDQMMHTLMDVIRSIFGTDQAWLLYPCDPDAASWRVPFRSTRTLYPIDFGPDEDLIATDDLKENCRLALQSNEPVPLGLANTVKDVPKEAVAVKAHSAMLIALHPKVGRPWLMGLHQCEVDRRWTSEEKRMYQDISGRIADALSTTLFYRDLEENQERLRHLSAQLFRAQEEERKRVASEIHDELGQAALAIKMSVENAAYITEEFEDETLKRSLASAAHLSKEMVDKMRRMQTSLYPPTLRDFGPLTALGGLVKDLNNIYTDVQLEKIFHITEDAIPDELRVPLFRLAQEAIYNALKHSQGDSIVLHVDMLRHKLELKISDNGIGFIPEQVLRYPAKRLGLGLTSMRERAEMHGGIFEVASVLEEGTTVRVVWDLSKEEPKAAPPDTP